MKPLLLTLGEPGGIGPDCLLRGWQEQPELFDNIIVTAPADWLEQRGRVIGINPEIQEHSNLDEAGFTTAKTISCWNPLSTDIQTGPVCMGKTSAQTATAVVTCIQAAAEACLESRAVGLVTCPIEKAVLRTAGFRFPGHTEFLAHLARLPDSDSNTDFVMMLASSSLRVALLTTHLAIRDVPDALSIAATLDCIRIVHCELQKRFGLEQPRLALCGLNPHAGEQGHFGREEIDILAPAAAAAQQQGINITTPMPADTAFSAASRHHYDAMICCYHDQALIPIKAISFGESVNVTLGLPFIRTSVDHGTALDLAGSEDVSCSSLLEAIRMAKQMAERTST